MVHRILFALALSSATALAACGGSQPPPAPPAPPAVEADAAAPIEPESADAGAPTAEASHEHTGFHALTKEQKVDIMMTKVVPDVGKVFKEHDPKKYAKFGCATCHGPEKNKEPHDVLPKLTLSNGGFEKLAKAKPAVMKFMQEKVTPAMVHALDEKPFDPATNQGFGCAGCHKVD